MSIDSSGILISGKPKLIAIIWWHASLLSSLQQSIYATVSSIKHMSHLNLKRALLFSVLAHSKLFSVLMGFSRPK